MELQVLLVQDNKDYFEVIGISTLQDYICEDSRILRASRNALEVVKLELEKGNRVTILKPVEHTEVLPSDLKMIEVSELDRSKRIALSRVNDMLNLNLLKMNIIDAMDYLNCYMKLLAAGIFITDSNREDKYFEIIEAAQENEEPNPISEDSTFEEEQNYIESKKKYDIAQENLNTLEKYLNAYDKLAKINFTNTLLNSIKEKILNSSEVQEVNSAIEEKQQELQMYFYSSEVDSVSNEQLIGTEQQV